MKDNNKKIIIAIIAVASIIVAIIGATFAFFSASGGSTNNAVTANATTLTNLGFTSSHSKIAYNLVPVSSESPYFGRYPGIAASGEHSCLDDVGNQICSIYEFTVTNTASVAQTIYVSFVPSENTFDNMYFAAFNTSIASASYVVATGSNGSGNNFSLTAQTTSGNSTLGHQATKLTKNSTDSIDMPGLSTNLGAGESTTYTILVWLQETGSEQNTEQGGIFKAGVNVTTGGNSTGVTGVMEGNSIYIYTTNFYSPIYIGQQISSSMTFYMTGAEAYNDPSNNLPAYFKHKLVNTTMGTQWCDVENATGNVYDCFDTETQCNNFLTTGGYTETDTCQQQEGIILGTVSESYLEFVITPETAASYSGLTAGTYTLRGGDGGAAYNTNIGILNSAFGQENCDYLPDDNSSYHCYYEDYSGYGALSVTVHDDGWVTSNNGLFCHIYNGAADCGIT